MRKILTSVARRAARVFVALSVLNLATAAAFASGGAAPQGLSRNEKLGAGLGIGAAIALLLIILSGGEDEELPFDECDPVSASGMAADPC